MKNNIILQQWDELKKGQYVWQRWLTENKYTPVAISGNQLLCGPDIPQMIEFLDSPTENRYITYISNVGNGWNVEVSGIESIKNDCLCDALWGAVKDVLKNEKTEKI